MQDLGADGRVILKRLLQGQDGRTWADRSDRTGLLVGCCSVVMKFTVP
jgi:hypothetical protein